MNRCFAMALAIISLIPSCQTSSEKILSTVPVEPPERVEQISFECKRSLPMADPEIRGVITFGEKTFKGSFDQVLKDILVIEIQNFAGESNSNVKKIYFRKKSSDHLRGASITTELISDNDIRYYGIDIRFDNFLLKEGELSEQEFFLLQGSLLVDPSPEAELKSLITRIDIKGEFRKSSFVYCKVSS